MSYTNIPKPAGSPYTDINAAKPAFDEPSLNYDNTAAVYDGANTMAYTNLNKPVIGAGYTNISKPT